MILNELFDAWSSMTFEGEKVFYKIAPYVFLHTGKGKPFDVLIALRSGAPNVECEFVKDPSVKVDLSDDERGYDHVAKHSKKFDKQARAVVTKYLEKNGLKKLKAKAADWKKQTDDYNKGREVKLSKAKQGMKSLPKGYEIVTYKGNRFAKGPEGMIPNQGVNAHKTDQDIIDNFYAWQALNQ